MTYEENARTRMANNAVLDWCSSILDLLFRASCTADMEGMVNIVIPMAGEGKRFQEAGYSFPKPLIEVKGKMMIEWAIKSVPEFDDTKFIFLVRPGFPWESVFSKLVKNFKVIEVKEVTEGALCTCLLAREDIDAYEELMIVNSDQYVKWYSYAFFEQIKRGQYDGGILLFNSVHPKWSYAEINEEDDIVTRVAEKDPISRHATCGIYYFTRGSDFVAGADSLIKKNIRFNNEFYVCPVYNEMIAIRRKIMPFHVNAMYGLGTPEDVSAFNQNINV